MVGLFEPGIMGIVQNFTTRKILCCCQNSLKLLRFFTGPSVTLTCLAVTMFYVHLQRSVHFFEASLHKFDD